jgi:hypothetical protein
MFDRQKRTKSELEYLCLTALKGRRELGHLEYVRLGPYRGQEGWTWDLVEVGPGVGPKAFDEALEVVRTLRHYYDMVEE